MGKKLSNTDQKAERRLGTQETPKHRKKDHRHVTVLRRKPKPFPSPEALENTFLALN